MDEQKIRNALNQGSMRFTLVFWISEGGSVSVQAESLAEAVQKLEAYLAYFAKDAHLSGRFAVANREWEILEADSGRA